MKKEIDYKTETTDPCKTTLLIITQTERENEFILFYLK